MQMEPRAVWTRNLNFSKRRIPALLTVFFLVYQAIGLDFGFASVLKRKCRLHVQRATRFVSTLSIGVMLTYLVFLYDEFWCWITAVKNIVLVSVLITMKYKPYHLIYDINGIIDALTTKQMNVLNIVLILYTCLMYLILIILMTVKCMWEKETFCLKFYPTFYFFVFLEIYLSLDVIVVAQIIISYYLRCSVNAIKALLKRPNRKLDLFEKYYRSIADCYDKIRPFYDWMVSFCL